MTTTLWIFVVAALVGLIAFVNYMRRLFRESREVEKRLDYSKMRKWEDEDD